ncbi:MAG: hypothetical protein MRY79_03190 [Alphaproteobacteria bacterium]|nr:hypothetical protein [Alphaproteobacteria bacterium]
MKKLSLFALPLILTFLTIGIVFLFIYYPRNASERLYYCVAFEMEETQFDSSDKEETFQRLVKILEDPCHHLFVRYKDVWSEKDKARDKNANEEELSISIQARKEAYIEFTPEAAAKYYLKDFYEP